MSTYSVAEVAGIISAANGWHPDAQAKAHRQIKHWRAEGLLTPSARQTDARGTDKFDEGAVYRARFLMVLADIGMDLSEMRTALWFLDQGGNAQRGSVQLSDAIAHIANGQDAFTCLIRIGRDGAGRKSVTARIDLQSHRAPALTDADRDNAEYADFYDQAHVTVPLNRVLRPIAKRLRNA